MTGPSYDLLVGAHVLSAVVGFGAVAASGTYAARGRAAVDPRREPALRRYFRPGTNWAERSLLATPVIGAILLSAGDSRAASQSWPWLGLGLWVLAAALVTARCWPAERRIQTWLAEAGDPPGAPGRDIERFREDCRTVQRSASAVSLCFVAAVVVMIAQPR